MWGDSMFYRVKEVEPLERFYLKIIFQNGEIKYYSVARLFDKWDAFKTLKDEPGLFDNVKVDQGGYGISWNDSIDLECNDLWEFGSDYLPE